MIKDLNTPTRLLPALAKTGRPSKFTDETRKRLVQLVAAGVPYSHACRAVRVSFVSFSKYRDQHPDFREELEEAVSLAIEKRLAKVEAASEAGDWRASSWLLEHLHPESFSRNRIEVTGADGAPLTAAIAVYLPQKDGAAPVVTVAPPKEIENGD